MILWGVKRNERLNENYSFAIVQWSANDLFSSKKPNIMPLVIPSSFISASRCSLIHVNSERDSLLTDFIKWRQVSLKQFVPKRTFLIITTVKTNHCSQVMLFSHQQTWCSSPLKWTFIEIVLTYFMKLEYLREYNQSHSGRAGRRPTSHFKQNVC